MATLEQILLQLVEQQKLLASNFIEYQKATAEHQRLISTALQQFLTAPTNARIPALTIPTFPPYEETAEDWIDYEKRLRQHFMAFSVTDPQTCKSLFLSWISPKLYQLLSQLAPLKEPSSLSFDEMCSLLTLYYKKQSHVVASRVAFYRCQKQPHQSYRAWATELQGLSRKCQFITEVHHESYADSMVRDAILRSAPDREVRQRALQLDNPTLDEVLTIAETFEITRAAGAQLDAWGDVGEVQSDRAPVDASASSSEEEVFALQSRTYNRTSKQQNKSKPKQGSSSSLPSCPRCFSHHSRDDCPQRWATCHNCSKKGHVSAVCRSKTVQNIHENDVDSGSVLFINSTISTPNKLYLTVQMLGKDVTMQVDTGSAATLITSQTYLMLGSPPLSPVSRRLRTYNHQQISLLGQLEAEVSYKSVVRNITVFVVDHTGTENLFGYDAFRAFGFSVDDTVNVVSDDIPYSQLGSLSEEFSTLFSPGLGCADKFEAHITLKPSARPKFFRARPLPVALRDAVKQELDRLTTSGVLLPVNASEWASPLVVVCKPNGNLRLCGDFKVSVNSQCLIDTYPMPRHEEMFSKLAGGQFFSKIDLSEAYHQLPLDEASRQFLVLNTPFGLYQYQRLPFGVASAPAIFQRFLEQLLVAVPGSINYQDDIVVTGTTTTEHLQNLRTLFSTLQSAGLKCNFEKSQFFQPSITYLGFRLSKDGIQPLREDVAAIQALPCPTSVKELQAFLGAIAYYHKFLPSVAEIAHPLHRLLRKNVPFQWSAECDASFQRLKSLLQTAPCLATYTPGQPLVLATDASQHGIGAVLSHKYPDGSERPIAYASKTLNASQLHYSQIEKEALAIIYALKKFGVFLYGAKFHLITDHKPLVSLFHPSASLPDKAAHRLQRWALFLSRFNYEIHFRPTTQHANADALSRLPMGPDPTFDRDELLCFHLDEVEHRVVEGFPITGDRLAEATAADPVLRRVLGLITDGWPDRPSGKVSDPLRNYFSLRFRLTSRNGVVLLATDDVSPRVVIPASLRSAVLKLLHQGHWGVSRTKTLARRHVYWPGIDADISHMVAACDTCASQAPAPKTSPSPWPAPSHPWERVHIDFAGPFLGTYWLLVIDAHSNFPFVVRCASPSTAATTAALAKIFALEGLPNTLVSDNGPQFISTDFSAFCAQRGIKHITAPPFHPQSNGEVERLVRTFKQQMKKLLTSHSTDEALMNFLASYRFTPMGDHSPAELLHGRQPRTLLHLLRPPSSHQATFSHGKFSVGAPVWVRGYGRNPKWIPGRIMGPNGRRLYHVRTSAGQVSRHLDQLRPRITPAAAQQAIPSTSAANCDTEMEVDIAPHSRTGITEQEENTPSTPRRDTSEIPNSQEEYIPSSPIFPPFRRTVRMADHTPTATSPIIGSRVVQNRKGHFRPYAKVPPRDFSREAEEKMDVGAVLW